MSKGINLSVKDIKDGAIGGSTHKIEAPPITDVKDIKIIGIIVL